MLVIMIVVLLLAGLITVFASPGGVSTLGDFIWFDENGNGVKDEGPEWGDSGIDGVLVNLYLDDGDVDFEPGAGDTLEKSMNTGDDSGTTTTEHGWYDFTEVGDHLGWWVEIPDSNFAPGGPLEGHVYTGNNASNAYNGPEPRFVYIPDTLTDYNDADFGYTLKDVVAIGNLVWHDANSDSTHQAEEDGIVGVTVKLYQDANGNGISEPDDDVDGDGDPVATTITGDDGIYQFLDVTPSTAGDAKTHYFVAVGSGDLTTRGYTTSSAGGDHNPDSNDDQDDGVPTSPGDYVLSQPFPATKGGQTTVDADDAVGHADSSSYMTVDFGFTHLPNAVTIASMNANGGAAQWGISWVIVAMVGLSAFLWRRRTS